MHLHLHRKKTIYPVEFPTNPKMTMMKQEIQSFQNRILTKLNIIIAFYSRVWRSCLYKDGMQGTTCSSDGKWG